MKRMIVSAAVLSVVLVSGRLFAVPVLAVAPVSRTRERARTEAEALVAEATSLAARGASHAQDPAAGHDREAFEAAERARARNLLDLIAEGHLDLRDDFAFTPQRLDAIQPLIDPSTALLEYAVGQARSFLFVVTREGFHTYALPRAADLESPVRDLRRALERPSRRELGRYIDAARRLYDLVVAPAAAVLKGKTRLLLAPDAALSYVPFEALLTADPGLSRLAVADQPYLIRRWAVGYVPSASVLASVRARAARARADFTSGPRPAFLGVADPILVRGVSSSSATTVPSSSQTDSPRAVSGSSRAPTFAPLPHARREVTDIAKRFKPGEALLLIGGDASEDRLKQAAQLTTARRVHFATHAVIDELDPARSALVLAGGADGSKEDGLLQVPEVFKLRLSADLVVVSACESWLGKELRGEGILGLTSAFLYAGASSVAVSLWPVADRSTHDLMVRFYDRMDRLDKLEALRQAKLAMIGNATWAHPYYWAPFVLVGDPK